ncbi:MAG: nucleotidyltransferase domain-containing protein [Phycisphaeraceae bacterium]
MMIHEPQRTAILTALEEIERDRGLRVLFACESGSRAWGFASRDSDYDVRFIYAYPAESYLKLRGPVDAFDLQMEGDLDLGGWDVRKTAELMRRSNPPLMEWLDSPIVYRAAPGMHERLLDLRSLYFDAKKASFHYLSMAVNVWRTHLEHEPRPVRKKYLYALRPLACVRYIAAHQTQPPTAFEAVLEGIDWPAPVMNAVRALVEEKKQDVELGASEPDAVLNELIAGGLIECEALAAAMPSNDVSNEALDEFLRDTILNQTIRCGA